MTIALAAGNNTFRYFDEGMLTMDDNCPTSIDHAVVITGYIMESMSTTTTEQTVVDTECYRASRNERRARSCDASDAVYNRRTCCVTTTTVIPAGTTVTETAKWKVQNSWGTDYGMDGFLYIEAVGGVGICGMNQYIEYVDVQ